MTLASTLHLWTVDEYHRMIDAGILTRDDRVELLEGQILKMSPQQPPHAATTHRAANYLRELLAGKADVRLQSPVSLSSTSEPEPDIAIVRIDPRDYFEHHPTPDKIFLLIEVADSTLIKDRKQKSAIYAKAKILDYWILDVNKRQVYIFRQPKLKAYAQENQLGTNETVALMAFPNIHVDLSQLFP